MLSPFNYTLPVAIEILCLESLFSIFLLFLISKQISFKSLISIRYYFFYFLLLIASFFKYFRTSVMGIGFPFVSLFFIFCLARKWNLFPVVRQSNTWKRIHSHTHTREHAHDYDLKNIFIFQRKSLQTKKYPILRWGTKRTNRQTGQPQNWKWTQAQIRAAVTQRKRTLFCYWPSNALWESRYFRWNDRFGFATNAD